MAKMSNRSRINWSSQEDQMLKQLKEVQNIQNWALIAENINKISLYTRNTKQCRQRYRSNVKCGRLASNEGDGSPDNDMILKWTKEEQNMILDLYSRFNSKWVLYIPYFKNRYKQPNHRSQNNIKNRFYNTIKRNITKINNMISSSEPTQKGMKKNKKELRLNQITCLLELCKKIQQSTQVKKGSIHGNDQNLNFNFNHLDLIQVKNMFIEGCKFCMDEEFVWRFLRQLEKVERVLGGIGIKRVKNKRFWKLDNRKFSYIIANNKIKNNKYPQNPPHQHNNPQQILKYTQIIAQQEKNQQCPSVIQGGSLQKNKIEQDQTPEMNLLNIESGVTWIEKFNFQLFNL